MTTTDNITAIPTGKKSRPITIGLAFEAARNHEASTAAVFTALRGVCFALRDVQGGEHGLEQFVRLSVAAGLLMDMLEERELSRPPFELP